MTEDIDGADSILDMVWASLTQIFGQRVAQQFGHEMPPLWRMKLGQCSRDELLRAIDHWATEGGAFPPTLPEFWQSCQHRRPSAQIMHRSLASADTVQKSLSTIRKIIGDPHARSE